VLLAVADFLRERVKLTHPLMRAENLAAIADELANYARQVPVEVRRG
jgi:hypothetical protein